MLDVALVSSTGAFHLGSGSGHCGSERFLRVNRPPLTSHLPLFYPLLPRRSHSPSGVVTAASLPGSRSDPSTDP